MSKWFIFIVGPPRTGTTYLLLLMMEHKLINNAFGSPYESNLLNSPDMKENKKAFLKADGDYIIYKNPNDARNPERILDNFKNCVLIYLVRNPFDMVTSYFHTPKGINLSVFYDTDKVINFYNEMAKNILKVSKSKRILFINSDDLFLKPGEVIKKIFKIIGLKFNNELIQKTIDKHSKGENIISSKKKIVYRVGHYSADKFLLDEQKEEIKKKCWDYYQELLSKCI